MPLPAARAWDRRNLASEGRTGPVTHWTFPFRSSRTKEAFCAANHFKAASETNPSEPMQTNKEYMGHEYVAVVD